MSGKVFATRPHGSGAINDGFHIFANLSINPTRFVHHQAGNIFHSVFSGELINEDMSLLQTRNVLNINPFSGEVPLDDNDNVLLTQRQRALAAPERWMRVLHYYYGSIIMFLDRSLEASGGIHDWEVRRSGEWTINLQNAETYWEFWSDNPIASLNTITPCIRALGEQNRTDNYTTSTEQRTVNSPSVSIRLRNGVKAKFYAKTNKRIRIEITHDLTTCGDIIGTGHTSCDVGDFFHWLVCCGLDAAERGNRILEHNRRHIME